MGKRPSFQFYPGDWMKDPALSMCAPATRGIWVDLLCAIHELDHAGQVTGTPEQLSRLCRCSVAQFVDALSEIRLTRSADVTERNGIVTVISRRMKRDNIEREKTNERVKKHRCNGFVTDNETRMKQDSSSSSSSSKEKEQQAAPKEMAAAAAFSENKIPEQELSRILDRIVEIRIGQSKRNGRPINSPATLRRTLLFAYKQNSDAELQAWKDQIAEDDIKTQKDEDRRRNEAESQRIQIEAEEQERRAKAEVDHCMSVYENLPEETKAELWNAAEEIEKRQIPAGINPFRQMIVGRVARLMRDQGYVGEAMA